MEKIVTSGMRDCTVNLDGSECAVKFGSPYRVFSVQNNSDNDVIVSIYEGKTAEDDGVRIIKPGDSSMLAHMKADKDTVYVTGSGSVAIAAGNEAVNPFSKGGKGGESWVNANGNPVTLTRLQGGVPFNEITVSGKNLFVPYPGYSASGTQTNGYRIREFADSYSYIAEIEHDTDYVIRSYSDGNRMIVILFYDDPTGAAQKDSKRIMWYSIPPIAEVHKTVTFNSGGYNYAILTIASDDPNIDTIIKDAQLEYGTEPTAYVPPITGIEMQLNVNGTDYSITPDTNPYTVPIDITQIDGKNVISIADDSQPVISVSANKKNSQLAKVYDEINKCKPQLLFSGVASVDSPAVVDLSRYEMIKILIKSSTSDPLAFWYGTIDYAVSWITDDNVLLGVSKGKSEQFSVYISNSGIYTLSSNDYINIYGINQHKEG